MTKQQISAYFFCSPNYYFNRCIFTTIKIEQYTFNNNKN